MTEMSETGIIRLINDFKNVSIQQKNEVKNPTQDLHRKRYTYTQKRTKP